MSCAQPRFAIVHGTSRNGDFSPLEGVCLPFIFTMLELPYPSVEKKK